MENPLGRGCVLFFCCDCFAGFDVDLGNCNFDIVFVKQRSEFAIKVTVKL